VSVQNKFSWTNSFRMQYFEIYMP